MKRVLTIFLVALFIISTFTSCSKIEIKEPSNAGAYCLMFKEFVENNVDLTRYPCLSFDTASCFLEGDELEILTSYIKDYCDENGIQYLEKDLHSLKVDFEVDETPYGEIYTDGFLLTFGLLSDFDDSDGFVYYTSEIYFWHSEKEAVGGRDFYLVKTDDGWYIDRKQDGKGYGIMLQ